MSLAAAAPPAGRQNGGDYALFFSGACQMQYLAHMFGAVTSAERFMVGKPLAVDVALDAPAACLVSEQEFLAHADRVRSEGRRAILVIHQTSRSEYFDPLIAAGDRFSDQLLIPHVHFRSAWPAAVLDKQLDELSDHTIRRKFAFERHGFAQMLARCGLDAPGLLDAYWEGTRSRIRFYRPAHPNGEVLAEILEAMEAQLAGRLPAFHELLRALRNAEGIFQNTAHPISARVGDLLDLSWSRTDFYRAWIELAEAGLDRSGLSRPVEGALQVLDDPAACAVVAWPHRAHLRYAVGRACLHLRRRDQGLELMRQATVELKGFAPMLRQTLNYAARYRRADVVEEILLGVAPVLDLSHNLHLERFRRTIAALRDNDTTAAALQRVAERATSESWLHRCLRSLSAASTAS